MIDNKLNDDIVNAKYCSVATISYELVSKIGDEQALQLLIGQLECLKLRAHKKLEEL